MTAESHDNSISSDVINEACATPEGFPSQGKWTLRAEPQEAVERDTKDPWIMTLSTITFKCSIACKVCDKKNGAVGFAVGI